MAEGVTVTNVTGKVFVMQGGATQDIAGKEKIEVDSEVETGAASHAIVSDNPSPESGQQSSSLVMFPKSKAVVRIRGGFIEESKILEGLVLVSTVKNVSTPTAEWNDRAWAAVAPGGETVVAQSRATVRNRNTGSTVTLDVNKQVLVTSEEIGEPEPVEQRFLEAQSMVESMGAFEGSEMYREVAAKSAEMLEANLAVLEELSKQAEAGIIDMDAATIAQMREEARRDIPQFKQWADAEAEKMSTEAEQIAQAKLSTAYTVPVDKSLEYQGVDLKVISVRVESKGEHGDLLVINMEACNQSGKQVFIFWNEESRLVNEPGEEFPVDDYEMETSYEPGAKEAGHLVVPVRREDRGFKLQFGKGSSPKVELRLDTNPVS